MNISDIKSELELKYIYFSKCAIERDKDIKTGDLNTMLDKEVEKVGEHSYEVQLNLLGVKDDLKLELEAKAGFTVGAGKYEDEEELMKYNATAIMFPFLRSQVTLMTSQPGMKPVIIPLISTNKLQ